MIFMHPTPCRFANEILMDFWVFFAAYPMDAIISGAFDASGANMKLIKNAGIPDSLPNWFNTSTIGSEKISTTTVPELIIHNDRKTIFLILTAGSKSFKSSGISSSSSSSSSSAFEFAFSCCYLSF